MKTIILRPYDDHDIVEVLIVDHEKPRKDFEKDFDKALALEKVKNPDEWQANDVLARLERTGWQILRPAEQITVTY